MSAIKICKYFLAFILSAAAFMLSACDKKQSIPEVNVELVGGWDSDAGCSATFTKNANTLVLVDFDDSHGHVLKNLELKYTKTGILSEFRSGDANISFYGNYSEGVMMITKYCPIPLYKVKN